MLYKSISITYVLQPLKNDKLAPGVNFQCGVLDRSS